MSALLPSDLPDLSNLLIAAGHPADPAGSGEAPGKSRLLFLDDADPSSGAATRELLAAVAPRGHVAILLRLEATGALQRLLQFGALPGRMRRAANTLRSMGIANSERFAVSPDVGQPVFIYSLRQPSAAYARDNILPPNKGVAGALRWLISRWAGCDPSIGAVLVIGRAP
jgi:hypothetical protein